MEYEAVQKHREGEREGREREGRERYIKNNTRVTVNNDFWSQVR